MTITGLSSAGGSIRGLSAAGAGIHVVDPDLIRDAMRSAVGRGVAPLPSSGGLVGDHMVQKFHVMLPLKHEKKGEEFGKSLLDDLQKKVISI